MKRLLMVGLACVVTLVGTAVAHAQQGPDELVRSLSDEVLSIVRQDSALRAGDTRSAVAAIEQVALPHFNLRRMTMLAVGRDWRDATPDQRERLVNGFYSMLVRTYSNALTQYRDQTIDFKPFRMAKDDTTVRVQTEIRQPGAQPVAVDYSLEKGADGWKVFDIVVAGVSLVTNYRGSFSQEIRAGGIEGLIRSLENANMPFAQGQAQQ